MLTTKAAYLPYHYIQFYSVRVWSYQTRLITPHQHYESESWSYQDLDQTIITPHALMNTHVAVTGRKRTLV